MVPKFVSVYEIGSDVERGGGGVGGVKGYSE